MKNRKDNLFRISFTISLLVYLCILLKLMCSSYEDTIAKLQKENKELEHTNKELMTSVESLYTQLNNAYDCDCGWYEDFYYEHAGEVGAYE